MTPIVKLNCRHQNGVYECDNGCFIRQKFRVFQLVHNNTEAISLAFFILGKRIISYGTKYSRMD